MFYLYIGSIIISYLIAKSSINNVENKLKKTDLNAKDTIYEKNTRKLCILIISCIPILNIVISIRLLIKKDDLYNIFKEAQCELIIQDNEELLNKYEKACISHNSKKRRTFEKQISIANNLINSGFDKNEAFNRIFN